MNAFTKFEVNPISGLRGTVRKSTVARTEGRKNGWQFLSQNIIANIYRCDEFRSYSANLVPDHQIKKRAKKWVCLQWFNVVCLQRVQNGDPLITSHNTAVIAKPLTSFSWDDESLYSM